MSKKKQRITLDQFITESKKPEKKEEETRQHIENEHRNDDQSIAKIIKEKSMDIGEMVSEFMSNIDLPEIKSPKMQYWSIDIIAKPGARILVITEKPKVASAFANALAGRNYKALRYGKIKVYHLRYKSYYVTIVPLIGHIMEYDTKKEYKSWTAIDPLMILKDDKSLIQRPRYPYLIKILRDLAIKHDILFIATDADEEGENIGWEAMQIVSKVKKLPVYRLWFLSVQPKELIRAFNNPSKPILSWAMAPEARKIIDALSGFSSTRELTMIGKKSEGLIKVLLRGNILSLGRVQSPALYLLFLRERYIRNFKPRPYWSLSLKVKVNQKIISAEHEKSPFYDLNEANQIYKKIQNVSKAIVDSVDSKIEQKRPEPPLNTNRALIMLNKILKISSKRAMKILEDLYLEGLITYPRTDTDKYPPKYDHSKNLLKLSNLRELGIFAKRVLASGAKINRNGRKLVGDHLPITPIDVPRPTKKLSDVHLKVYELIVRRYIALFMDNAIIRKNKAVFLVADQRFIFSFASIERLGFMEVYPFAKPKTFDLNLTRGLQIPIDKIDLQKKMTRPPDRLTEAELLRYMERLGLGTKATRPEHIQKLIDRKYVARKRNKLYVTELGYKICEMLENLCPEFLRPYFSAYVLSLLRRIMNNEIDYISAVKDARKKFFDIFMRLRKARGEVVKVLSNIS
ncbi:MAG: DNA topoisomerase, partial [Candidatus Njordarchaeota archaeon]